MAKAQILDRSTPLTAKRDTASLEFQVLWNGLRRDVDSATTAAAATGPNATGWEVYNHGGGAQALAASTRTKLQIDGATSITSQGPVDAGALWDTTNDKITGRNGDAITVKIQLTFTPDDATASDFTVDVDIGGAIGIVERQDFAVIRGAGVAHYFAWTFVAYTLGTWEANGGEVYATCDGPGDITDLRIVIARIHKAR
jgi:hypothetical protein